ncbi:MAG: DUF58 domain-containing protein [Planctomycetota bacterium]
MRPHPTGLLVAGAALNAGLAVTLAFAPGMLGLLLAVDGALIGIAGFDLLRCWYDARSLRAELCAERVWSLQRDTRVTVEVAQNADRRQHLRLVPDLPRVISTDAPWQELVLVGRQRARCSFTCRGERRGSYTLCGVRCALRSRLRLWQLYLRRGDELSIHVYPNLKQINEYGLLARSNRLGLIGVRTGRPAGGDTEFERLRGYQTGDALARIDWKATARRDTAVVREYRTSENQNVIFLLDAGRMMGADPGAGERGVHLDHAIDATLMLAHVALGQGDRVGLLAYDDAVRRFVPPGGGGHQRQRLIHTLHDLHPSTRESRHDLAFLHLGRRVRKRSLVILISAFIDAVNATMLHRHLVRLTGTHLPLAVMLRHHDLYDHLAAPPENPDQLYAAGAAALIANWRQTMLERLERDGVLLLDTAPEDLTAGLVSTYLSLKARHLL